MDKSWKTDLGTFLNKKEHYCETVYNSSVLDPLFEELMLEFARYDDFEVVFNKSERIDRALTEYLPAKYSLFVGSKRDSTHKFKFRIVVWFYNNNLIISDLSFRWKETIFDVIKEDIGQGDTGHNQNRTDILSVDESMNIEYVAAIITQKFKCYYEDFLDPNEDNISFR